MPISKHFRLRNSAVLAAVLMAFGALPAQLFAQATNLAEVGEEAGLGSSDLMDTIGTVIGVVLGFMGVVFLLLLIYSGITWMTAGGDEDKVKRARAILVNATIGLVLTLSAYAIATFVINALGEATGSGDSDGDDNAPPVCTLCSSLGSGPIRDHYPSRNATGIARNARIIVTFKEAMSLESIITSYDDAGTPTDTSDDTAATALNTEKILIYAAEDGEDGVLTDVSVTFTDDLKTFVFDPASYLGSATTDTTYIVSLDNLFSADGDEVFDGNYDGGYEWSFEVSTTLDLTPPEVQSVVPVASGSYDRNIVVEITFDEAVDPTAVSGTREASSGFQNIQTVTSSGIPEAGTYEISNVYRTVTFTSTDACGTNSCGETIYCLPGNETITVTALAATIGDEPPQASSYDGVVDMAGNSLDGNGDGTAGDDYAWSFGTTDDINLEGPTIESINPNILEEGVSLDQDITITFTELMRTSTLTNDHIAMDNTSTLTGQSHELWYTVTSESLDSAGTSVVLDTQTPAKTQSTVLHGVFVESTDLESYLYSVVAGEGVQNQYQNCYSPAEGPDSSGNACDVDDTSPSCCNGASSSATCDFWPDED